MQHITVLATEAVDGLALTPTSVVVDATVGSGGHARKICEHLTGAGHYIGIDADEAAIVHARTLLKDVRPRVTLLQGNFAELSRHLDGVGAARGTVNAVLADLGWRMDQFIEGGKGFSFRADEPLLMTYGDPAHYPFTAADMLNDWTEVQLATIIGSYGEERYATRIARAIMTARTEGPVQTTEQLVRIIESAVPPAYRHGRLHPATRTFQALRMTVNDELTVLEALIDQAIECLAVGGRLAIITFHSLEDRVVKHRFRDLVVRGQAALVTRRPGVTTREEVLANPRARSAKLRIITKLPNVN